MFRSISKKVLLGTIVAATACLADAPQANATWWWGHSSGGSSGGYGSHGSWRAWGSSGGWRARRAFRRSYYSSGGYGSYGGSGSSGGYAYYGGSSGGSYYGGSHGSYYGGSSGGSSGGYYGGSNGGYYGGSSGGYYGGSSGSYYGSTGGGYIESGAVVEHAYGDSTMPAEEGTSTSPSDADPMGDAADPGADADPAPAKDGASAGDSAFYRGRPANAVLNVSVPNEARVFVNGRATTSTGATRRYVSKGLKRGFQYTYELKAEVVRDGKTVTRTEVVRLQAGERANVSFDLNEETIPEGQVANEPVRTKLTLHVPAEAKVFLSGNETRSTGDTREFTTTKLPLGAEWAGYVVRVELEREGRTLVQERELTLKAGQEHSWDVDFEANQVALADASGK